MKILYSFGMGLGNPGVGYAAREQIKAYHDLGCELTVYSAFSCKGLPPEVKLVTTLQMGRIRLPKRPIGIDGGLRLHDRIVAHTLDRGSQRFDVVHTWPACSERTLHAARLNGALAVREAPNTHTEAAYSVVEREHLRLGVPLSGSHKRNEGRLRTELREYAIADLILVASELAVETFVERGISTKKIAIKRYGFDPARFAMNPERARSPRVTFTFIAKCEPRKGLHLALQAWRHSGVAESTRLVVVGDFAPGYLEIMREELEHPNVELRGFVANLESIYAETDVLILPSLEEGSALVTYDAQGAGCALLVSKAAGAWMTSGVEGLIHMPGDVQTLAEQVRLLATDRETLAQMQKAAFQNSTRLTWLQATQNLLAVFSQHRQALARPK